MSNYKVIYESWHHHLSEAPKYDFEPGSPTNKLPREIKKAVEDAVIDFGADMSNRDIPPEDLIAYKQEVLGDQSRPTWLYFVRKLQGDEGPNHARPPIPIGSEEFIELWSTEGLDMRAWNGPYPDGNPSAAELAMGNLWVKSAVGAIEQQLGREIDVPMAVEVMPDLDFQDLGVSSEEELSQIDLNDFDLDALGFDEPEPQEAPVPAEMAPDADVEPAVPEEPEPELDDQDKVVAGINSDVYPDSLMNILKSIDFLTKDERGLLLRLMLKATEEDDVVLEAIGDPDRGPRTFSPETTTKLNDLILSFGLEPKNQKKLERTIQKWARMNTVKFSAPSKEPEMDFELPPEASEPVDGDPQPEDEEGETEPGEDTEEKEELSTLDKVELGIEAALNTVSAAGVIPAFEATLIPSVATLGSLVFNLGRGKMSAALLDIVALAPVVGKASKLGKLGPIGAKIAAKVGPASFKGGRLLIKTFGSAKNARAAITTMKSAKAAKDLTKAGAATKELIENVPEEWITAAIYKKQSDGDYWIDTVLGGVATLSSLPGIPDGIGTAADELKQSVGSLRRAFPPPKGPAPEPTDLPEPGMDPSELTETLDRWQTLAGINKRIL